ncbi:MAG: hypothetical protein RLZZ603_1342 [Actinomycetota bacterium]
MIDKTKAFGIFLAVVLAISPLNAPALATTTAKAGAKCPKAGVTQVVKSKKYTCVVKGKLLVWNSGTAIPVMQIPRTPCDQDASLAGTWGDVQKYFSQGGICLGPLKVEQTVLTATKPASALTSPSMDLRKTACTVTPANSSENGWPDSYQLAHQNFPSPNTVIQVVPIYTTDSASPARKPASDYSRYFDFITSLVTYDSDNGSRFQIRVPDKYFKLPKTLEEYGITHDGASSDQQDRRRIYAQDVIDVSDAEIDYSDVDMVLVVAPPGTPLSLSVTAGLSGQKADGKVIVMHQASPATLTYPVSGHGPSISPMWWFHEMLHTGIGFADHNGSGYWQNQKDGDPNKIGMGHWGIMSMALTDLLAYEKWVLGYISDEQVRCINTAETSSVWLSPASIKSKNVKLAVVPINDHQWLAIESQRAGGINYMLGQQSEGVLVYLIDTATGDRESSVRMVLKAGYKIGNSSFLLGDEPMKKGEYTSFGNVTVSVIESGAFGDVVRIQRQR